MPHLLRIETSPRGEYSISRRLTTTFVEAWTKTHSGAKVVDRDLLKTHLPFIDLPWIFGAYTAEEQHTAEMAAALCISLTS